MSTLLRLLRPARRFSPRPLAKLSGEPGDALLQAPTLLLANRLRHRASLVDAEPAKGEQPAVDLDHKFDKIGKEITFQGRITNFNIDHIISDVEKSESVTSLQGLFLLRSCSEIIDNKTPEERRELGNNVWQILKKLEIKLDVSHYNALLALYLETEYDFSVLDFLNEMINSDVKPNRVTYERLISKYCYQGKLLEANQILDHMKKEEISVNETTLSLFIYGYSIINDTETVAKILEEIKTLKIQPTIKTYSAFMYAYAQKGDIKNLRRVLKECEEKDIWVPNKVLLRTIYYLSINGFEEHIDEILALTTKSVEYVREANKTIYKLLEKKQDNIAFKLFQSLPKEDKSRGKFFIHALINFNIPVEKSAEYCKIMEEEGLDERAFTFAIKRSIANDMYESSMTLMKAWKELGGEIKEYYFYPILKTYGHTNQSEDVKKVLQKMILDFNINPSPYTLSTYVLPYIAKDWDKAMSALIGFPITRSTISNAVLLYFLSQNELQNAVRYIRLNSGTYRRRRIKTMLIQAFKNTEDVPSFVWILHHIYFKALKDNGTNNADSIEFLDSCILEIIDFLASNKYLNLMFFRNLRNKGLSISPEAADEILDRLGENASDKIVEIVNELKSGVLEPLPIQRGVQGKNHFVLSEMNVKQLENINLRNLNSQVTLQVKTNSLVHYCCMMNEEKVNEILQEFKKVDRQISESIYALLICMYINLDKVEKAEHWLNDAKTKFPHFRLNKILNLKLMTSLVENGEIEKAQNLIGSAMPSTVQRVFVNKLLDAVAKHNNEDLLQSFFDQLQEHGYINKLSPSSLTPLIQFHLSRNDGKAAHQKYIWLHNHYGHTPYPVDMMRQLVSTGEDETLEQVVQFYQNTYGKSRCCFYLAIAYLEHDCLDQAKHLIENNCSNLSEKIVMHFAETYYHNGQVDNLEKLFIILNESNFDVECLCLLLLKSYSIRNDYKKCYELWVKMQEDNIKPPPDFFNLLDEILKNKDTEREESLEEFYSALQSLDLERARNVLDRVPKMYKSDCYSILCHKYVSNGGRYSDVLELWRDLYEQYGLNLNPSTAEFVLSKFSNIKDVGAIELIERYLSPDLKKKLNFSYYLNKVHNSTGSWNLFLKKLEKKLNDNVYSHQELNIHFKSMITALKDYPDLIEQYESLAYKFSEKNIQSLMYPLWACYFLEKNPKADDIWLNYITDWKLFFETKIIHFLQNHEDLSLYVKLAELAQKSDFNETVKFSVYSKLMSSCLETDNAEKYKYALKCLEYGILDVPMQQFDIDLLADLQNGLEQLGVSWPWSTKLQSL